eukprot:TRINITY_DN16028_c0_g1_i1.p1 TRINITY_DN16028_c0_g1~~TRINITY_DN16028_c0_g1_i1.p1  ORF type:complete len:423 (-),score=93.18 TRINITY_DN16028_c0_g1_i1:69-1337(-)
MTDPQESWIKRDQRLIPLTGPHPFNAEVPLKDLVDAGIITPTNLHYVRNHGEVPKLTEDHVIKFSGLINNGVDFELSLKQLKEEFTSNTRLVTLVCDGNRRKEVNMLQKSKGFNWGPAAAGSSYWTGVRLSDILRRYQVQDNPNLDDVRAQLAEDERRTKIIGDFMEHSEKSKEKAEKQRKLIQEAKNNRSAAKSKGEHQTKPSAKHKSTTTSDNHQDVRAYMTLHREYIDKPIDFYQYSRAKPPDENEMIVKQTPLGIAVSQKYPGISEELPSSIEKVARFVCFDGAETLPEGVYGTSLPLQWCLNPDMEIMIAYKMNGQDIPPDHGYPVRLICPGIVGGRSIKWLSKITVSSYESYSHYHYADNKVLPSSVRIVDIIPGSWFYRPEFILYEMAVSSVISSPEHGEKIDLKANNETGKKNN